MAFFSTLQSIIIDLVVAVLIIFLGLVIARFLGNLTRRILNRQDNQGLLLLNIKNRGFNGKLGKISYIPDYSSNSS